MYTPPSGPELSQEQRQELDDTFLASDPFGYIKARVDMLLRWAEQQGAESGKQDEPAKLTAFGLHLGMPHLTLDYSIDAAQLQCATDAFALRQHAAESLVRLVAAVLDQRERPGTSLWECLSDGKHSLDEVIKSSTRRLQADDHPDLGELVLAAGDHSPERREELFPRLEAFDAWYCFAIRLVSDNMYGFNTANNKLKHGPAVRGRQDVRMTFMAEDPTLPEGQVRLSTLTGPDAVDIINAPLVEVLSRSRKDRGRVWEAHQIIVDTELLLSEAYMIAWTHSAVFASAARRHFDGQDHVELPEFPGYPPAGLTPSRSHLMKRLESFRMPLTVAPGIDPAEVDHLFAYRGHYQPARFGTKYSGVVVADDTNVMATDR